MNMWPSSLSSVVIHELNVVRSRLPVRPLETQSPLPIDANGVLAQPVASERFAVVSGKDRRASSEGAAFRMASRLAAWFSKLRNALTDRPSANARVALSR